MKFVSVRIMDSRELKARGNCDGRVISDIVKRRSFRVSIVILKEIAAGTRSRHICVDARKGIAAEVLCRLCA